MSGATRTIQQPARSGSLNIAIGLTALVAATAVAFAVAVGTAGRATQISAPAPLYAPVVRDLGARDLGTVNAGEVMPKAGDAPTIAAPAADEPTGYHGFGGPAPKLDSNGSNQAAPGFHHLGLRPS